MSPKSIAEILDRAFANKDNVIPDEPQTAYGKALQQPGDEHARIFNRMVRSNMGFNVKIAG
jgi:hypothetical protein